MSTRRLVSDRHFVDDMVMPGTLMYEGCLRLCGCFASARLGGRADQRDLHYAPIPGHASGLRCRGQVLQSSKKIIYRIDIKELGYDPEPVLADAVMFVDEKKAVQFANVSYRLHGLDEANIAAGYFGARRAPRTGLNPLNTPASTRTTAGADPGLRDWKPEVVSLTESLTKSG